MSHEKDEWREGYDAFMEKYPDAPQAKPVECLNLIMRKEFAEEIIKGRKKIEFRAYSKHYCERLYDKDVAKYIEAHADDEELCEAVGVYFSPLRDVVKIHFHNYNNTWYMDCKVSLNDVVAVLKDDVEFLQDEFGCHELDEELDLLEKSKAKNRPLYFYFVIDEVIDTNLK